MEIMVDREGNILVGFTMGEKSYVTKISPKGMTLWVKELVAPIPVEE